MLSSMRKAREVFDIFEELNRAEAILLVLSWVVIMAAAIAAHAIDSGISLVIWSLAGFVASSLLVESVIKLTCAILDRV